jgi:hypothetical protein
MRHKAMKSLIRFSKAYDATFLSLYNSLETFVDKAVYCLLKQLKPSKVFEGLRRDFVSVLERL